MTKFINNAKNDEPHNKTVFEKIIGGDGVIRDATETQQPENFGEVEYLGIASHGGKDFFRARSDKSNTTWGFFVGVKGNEIYSEPECED